MSQNNEKYENTPGRQAMAVMKDINKEIIFKKPIGAPRKRHKEKVLDEDTYVEEIGKIIQRDFFPDLEKLKAQNEYLDAMERNDMTKMRELYMKYSGNRPPTQRIPSPATFETPANIHNSQVREEPPTEPAEKPEPKVSLDQFLNVHTSEDNRSFCEILAESEKRHQEKYSYLYNEEDKSEEDRLSQLALPSVEQQAALPEKKLNVDTWSYKNKNYIMYIPDGVPLTQEQEIELNKKKQEVVHANTRLTINPFNENQSKEAINELAKTQAKVLDGKIGVDGKELMKSDSPKIRGFGFIKTPSPHPGVTDTPLMTWGEIEGTPFRLDGSDTPLPRSQGPSFKMAEPPRREQLALALAEKVGEKNRDRKQKAIDAARRRFATPSPRALNSAERLATMSPAARRLATSKLGLGTDLGLSYSPSPRAKTPSTPKRVVTPKLNLGIRKVDDNLTDDLLKINVPKRQKAADFF
ncbi:splicing factor ESS-2 homolog [Zophobas morio]|uniref:splicing factor ESS-2 homolog n=1 Tax=Zophobas morio TaxID=2755281 RepID=UPI003083D60E